MTATIESHRWHPPHDATPQKRGIYLLHGIGEHAGRYERFATFLTSLGYEVAAHDHPGHGKSSGKRGVIEHDNALVDVAADQFRVFEAETGSTPILFGHSLGGLVATSIVLQKKATVAALMLSAPAYAPFIGPVNKLKLRLLEMVAPRFAQQLPYNAELLTHDPHEQERGRQDPLNHRYKSASVVGWIVRAGSQCIASADTLNVQTLILVPGNDVVVDASQTQVFIDNAPDQLITARHYDNYLHEMLNETPDRREKVHADIEQWLKQL